VIFPVWLTKEAVGIIRGFLIKDREQRLGCGSNGEKDIKTNVFFRPIDWDKLERREIEPPFKPPVKNAKSTENFDQEFLCEPPQVTPTDAERLAALDHDEFKGFSWVNDGWNQVAF